MTVLTPHINVAPPSAQSVWQAYRSSGDPRELSRLLFTLAPLVRFAGARSPEAAEAGLAALAAAVEVYDPDADGPLESFAWAYVRAALAA